MSAHPLPRTWETQRLAVHDSTPAEVQELQQINDALPPLRGWTGRGVEGQAVDSISLTLAEGVLPPGGSLALFRLQSVRLRDRGELIGFQGTYQGFPSADTFWVTVVAIHPSFQRQGYGTELMRGLVDTVRQLGAFTRMRGAVSLKNWPSLRLCLHAGLARIVRMEENKSHSDTAEAHVTLEKPLAEPVISWATPLYEFLRRCNASSLEKRVLDCGAGGRDPPLALFHRHGYAAYGVEIAPEPLAQVQRFCQENTAPLHIVRGDMRALPFPDASFPFVYAFNSILFMTKPDIAQAMREIERVLVPGGLCYVNFMSADHPDRRRFCETAAARQLLGSDGWAHHADDEPDSYFRAFQIELKQKRLETKRMPSGRMLTQVCLEYITQKR